MSCAPRTETIFMVGHSNRSLPEFLAEDRHENPQSRAAAAVIVGSAVATILFFGSLKDGNAQSNTRYLPEMVRLRSARVDLAGADAVLDGACNRPPCLRCLSDLREHHRKLTIRIPQFPPFKLAEELFDTGLAELVSPEALRKRLGRMFETPQHYDNGDSVRSETARKTGKQGRELHLVLEIADIET